MNILKSIFGSRNDRVIRRMEKTLAQFGFRMLKVWKIMKIR